MDGAKRQILAIGGLPSEGDNRPLFEYLLNLAGKPGPAVGFISTARGDAPTTLQRFDEIFAPLDCRRSHLGFFDRTPNLHEYVAAQDVIMVWGGNTKSMLGVWREWGMPDILRQAWLRGTVLAGVSAGAICWFEQGLTDSFAGRLRPLACLGFLPGSCCPHYDGEIDRRPAYHELVRQNLLKPGIAIEDGSAVLFQDRAVCRVVAPAGKVGAWTVRSGGTADGGDIVEQPLMAQRLEL
ncbi:MAG TPA: peptidase E [Pirellulales bacterium]|nr:peptidase E [Pirellulales bacterium]